MPSDTPAPQSRDEILDRALELRGGERSEFLRRTCGGDEALRAELEAVLRESEGGDPLLSPGGALGGPLGEELAGRDDAVGAAPGNRVGPYRIVRELGRGGMAVVYLAERADGQFEQRVALKLLQPGGRAADLVSRFQSERQILASLDHPNIARLLDGGVAGDGRPYFAMEHVDGQPIDRYCDERRLPVRARLELFLAAAGAVQAAHRSLIVHRDLKPTNILVTGAGVVKLLDFGIAKPLDPETMPFAAPPTRTMLRVLTPEYASPEQVRGEPIGTASDIYQLGLLLYELLAGQRAQRVETGSPSEIERRVCVEAPLRPSTAAARGSGTLSAGEIAAGRGATRAQLRRRLAGDLDNIVLKALRKEPERRYATAEAMAQDVRRYLAHEPVSARPDSVLYRGRKFVRRHAVPVAAAAALVLAIAAVTAFYTGRLAAERDRAEQAAAFLASVLEEFEPEQARGTTVSLEQIFDRVLPRIHDEFAAEPLLQAELLGVVGRVYQHQGLFEEAGRCLEEALFLRTTALGVDDVAVADSQLELAVLRNRAGSYDVEPLFEAAIRTYRRRVGVGHPSVADAMTHQALALRYRGDYAAAERLFRQVAEPGDSGLRPADHTRATALTYLGKLLTVKHDFEAARSSLEESLALRHRQHGESHPVVANVIEAIGELELEQGRLGAAERHFEEALAMRLRFFEPDHPDVAATAFNLARIDRARGRLAEAEERLVDVVSAYRAAFGEASSDLSQPLRDLATVVAERGDLARAATLFEEALAIWRDHPFREGHPHYATLLRRVAALRLAQGRPAQAEDPLRLALEILRRTFAPGHAVLLATEGELAACLVHLRRHADAEEVVGEGGGP